MAVQRLKKDDTVLVIAGRERGKSGKVLKVIAENGRVLIERVNMIKRHQKARSAQVPGEIIEREASINASNVMLLCGKCSKPTRISRRRTADGSVRICKQCGEQIGQQG